MFKNTSLRIKLFFLVTTVMVISFLSLTWTISNRSIEIAKSDAFSLAEEMAEKYKNEIMAELQGARVTSETLQSVLETLKYHDATDRDMMNDILRNALAQKEYITAFCMAYEPNMLDGSDAEYADQWPMYNETGRFAPYWNKLGGSIAVEPLADIDVQDWYIVPKETGKEYITDPYPFQVQGQDVMLTSFIFPIMHDGEFIGIIASDIVLDKLQEMVAQVNTRGMGDFTEIFSNSGMIVAHPDKQYLGQTFSEALLYDLLAYHPENIDAVLPFANEYIAAHPIADPSNEDQAAEYNDMIRFTEGLQAYAANSQHEMPDISLLTPEFTDKMLEALPDVQSYDSEITSAIRNGQMYISSNDAYYTVFMPIQFSEATNPWSVAVSIPMSEVLKSSNDIRNYMVIVCIISIGVIAVILYLISRSVTSPMLKLAAAARQLGEGSFNVELPPAQNNDEIGVLSNAFKAMAQKINDLVKKLQNNANELEKKNDHLYRLNEMLVATNHVAETMLNVEHQRFQDILHQSLRLLGKGVGAEGVSIWENYMHTDGKVYSRRLSVWFLRQAQFDLIPGFTIDPDRFLPGWSQPAEKKSGPGNAVIDGTLLRKSFDEFKYCNSLLFIPLMLHDSYWGFIAFSYAAKQYHMENDEYEILRSGGMMIASSIIQNQITEDLKEAEEMASTDPLTELTNRNGFLIKAPVVYTTCKIERLPLTLLFFDLDHFKQVNDEYGHPFGDEVLKAFAAIIRQETGIDDVCCRYGGEEFILLLSDCGASDGRATADRILEAVRGIRFQSHPNFSITVSIGMITGVPGKYDTLNGYIQSADNALYMAKENGRNQVVVSPAKRKTDG
ncbi:MAG: diguanylate cyclase [Christensenellaceae bacterium]|jgi:diguanylate cyclase (GGDEF)-like protein